MRFFVVAFLMGLVSGDQNVTLSDVYGPKRQVAKVEPWHLKGMRRAARPTEYFGTRTAENCVFPLEVVILQDCTSSFEDDFQQMKSMQLPTMVDTLSATHPGSTFGVTTFRDKPIWSLGEPASDYCTQFDLPLTSEKSELVNLYENLISVGGGDPSENQFGTIVAAAQSNTPGWSNPLATRLIVVATDAPPHFEGDMLNVYGMSTFSGIFDESNAEQQCLDQYYPSPEQVNTAILGREAYVAFLVFDGSYWNELPRTSWEWFNAYIGQDANFVDSLAEDSSNFWELLSQTIKGIEDIECTPSTTEAPTTTMTVTTTDEVTVTNAGPIEYSSTESDPTSTERTATTASSTTVEPTTETIWVDHFSTAEITTTTERITTTEPTTTVCTSTPTPTEPTTSTLWKTTTTELTTTEPTTSTTWTTATTERTSTERISTTASTSTTVEPTTETIWVDQFSTAEITTTTERITTTEPTTIVCTSTPTTTEPTTSTLWKTTTTELTTTEPTTSTTWTTTSTTAEQVTTTFKVWSDWFTTTESVTNTTPTTAEEIKTEDREVVSPTTYLRSTPATRPPRPTQPGSECAPPCEKEPCPPCDEVEIRLRHKPKELRLEVINA